LLALARRRENPLPRRAGLVIYRGFWGNAMEKLYDYPLEELALWRNELPRPNDFAAIESFAFKTCTQQQLASLVGMYEIELRKRLSLEIGNAIESAAHHNLVTEKKAYEAFLKDEKKSEDTRKAAMARHEQSEVGKIKKKILANWKVFADGGLPLIKSKTKFDEAQHEAYPQVDQSQITDWRQVWQKEYSKI
jgi:hypothetical protein